jgi:hypothetical protein
MSFLTSISFEDLQRLRAIVRQVHMKHYPMDFCTDRECDKLIDSFGQKVVESLLKRAIDEKFVN